MMAWLPLTPDPPAARPEPARRVPIPHGTETVLVVDDEPGVTRVVVQMLSSLGYCVVAHTEPEAAIGFLQTNAEDVDLILLDLNLPRWSGTALFDRLHALCPSAPVLLTSGFDDAKSLQAMMNAGAAGFMQKPFSLATLAHTVRQALDGEEKR
jgi:two-component system, cell cycle sensor histidine kinase and response regulator CckA